MQSTNMKCLNIQEHCAILASTLHQIWERDNRFHQPLRSENRILTFYNAKEWLELAASVVDVNIVSARFEEGLDLCELALEYENARSKAWSDFSKYLTIFLFTWGTFETVVKVLDLQKIPHDMIPNTKKKIGPSDVHNKAIYYIRNEEPLELYENALRSLKRHLEYLPGYPKLYWPDKLPAYSGITGVGINFVYEVRNGFAHGDRNLPEPINGPKGWDWNESGQNTACILRLCIRIVLYTIQMILLRNCRERNNHLEVEILRNEDGETISADISTVLQELHIDHTIG